jgi:hypothetical protein
MSIVGTGNVAGTGSATFGIEMTTTAPVEGYVIAVSYDNTDVAITNVTTAGSVAASAGAELVVPEVLATGFTLGVVLDAAAPFLGQTIPAGANQNIGSFTAQSIVILGQGDPPISTGFQFVNGVLNNPPLDNILVQGGLSIGQGQGLTLNGNANAMTINPPPPAGLEVESASSPSTSGGCARILLDNDAGATQGFVLSVSHNNAFVTLVDIDLAGTAPLRPARSSWRRTSSRPAARSAWCWTSLLRSWVRRSRPGRTSTSRTTATTATTTSSTSRETRSRRRKCRT